MKMRCSIVAYHCISFFRPFDEPAGCIRYIISNEQLAYYFLRRSCNWPFWNVDQQQWTRALRTKFCINFEKRQPGFSQALLLLLPFCCKPSAIAAISISCMLPSCLQVRMNCTCNGQPFTSYWAKKCDRELAFMKTFALCRRYCSKLSIRSFCNNTFYRIWCWQ